MDNNRAFDLVILDLMLPGDLSGMDVCRSLSSTLDVPIMVLTAMPDRDAQIETIKSMPIEDYFIKPVDVKGKLPM